MVIDVTDATFQAEVIDRSRTVPVVVDLWAAWCGPCQALGPLLEDVVNQSNGEVVLAKVDIDANPGVAAHFQVQSIPAVHAMVDGQVVNSFVGARGEREVRAFVEALVPTPEQREVAALLAKGDEASLRAAVELAPADEGAVVALAEHLVELGTPEASGEALELLARLPASAATRAVAARARLGEVATADESALEARLAELLDLVKDDEAARTEFLDVLELLGPEHPNTVDWRRKLTTRLY